VANPSALVLAACMMLEYMNDGERATRVRRALETTIRERKTITRDLGGTASTDQFTDAVIARL
jgi:isocitrate dehydrogenase (NAD+)